MFYENVKFKYDDREKKLLVLVTLELNSDIIIINHAIEYIKEFR